MGEVAARTGGRRGCRWMDALSFGHSQKSKILASSRKEGAKTHWQLTHLLRSVDMHFLIYASPPGAFGGLRRRLLGRRRGGFFSVSPSGVGLASLGWAGSLGSRRGCSARGAPSD